MRKKLLIIFIFSLTVAILAFFMDGDARESSLFVNVFEVCLFAILLFLVISINFFAISFVVKRLTRLLKNNGAMRS